MYRVSYGLGQYRTAEQHVLLEPAGHRRDGTRPLIVWAHGASVDAVIAADTRHGGTVPVHLARIGFVVLCIDADGAFAFMRDGAMTAMSQAITYGRSAAVGASTGPIGVGGLSMGAGTGLSFAADNTSTVGAAWGGIPLTDIDDVHDNNLAGYASTIETAYGGLAAYDAAEPFRNPAKRTADLANVPILLHAATDDGVARWTPAQTFATATGAELVSLGAVGHTGTACDQHATAIGEFFLEHLGA